MAICVMSIAYGNYWDNWGKRWLENLESLSTQPDRIMLLSDEKKNVPAWVENIAIGDRHMSQYANVGANLADTEWIVWHGLDDLYLDDAFLPFDESGDVFSYPHILGGIVQGIAQYSGQYETMYNLDWNPMLGGFFHRRSLVLEIPYRKYGYMDEVQFCEMAWFNKKVVFDDKPRSIWYRHDNAHAMWHNEVFRNEANDFKYKLRNGQIEKGVPELDRI
jgi:hypothetical protein